MINKRAHAHYDMFSCKKLITFTTCIAKHFENHHKSLITIALNRIWNNMTTYQCTAAEINTQIDERMNIESIFAQTIEPFV